ncbi:hypothetical protein CAPTEDRAFT_159056 [Capitella teleta]|uniref:Aldehyde dehydrogenase domain-containing protein n=1 Tax=Capitella teleta TaxID=283909 RepID=R7UFV5_CAPTE|nr:hypothetical protein CAPTEDRAFT_159056 [Capitella teleta]|eukprot:ELU05419.1 hypothetical protein CAPTEDRAFT_159056 [Capitella teleta]
MATLKAPEIKFTQLFINNEFVDSASGKTFEVLNPTTGKPIVAVQEADKADVDKAAKAAKNAFEPGSVWRSMNASTRGRYINKLADAMEKNLDYMIALESLDNGKPIPQSQFDIEFSIRVFRYFAGWTDKITGKTLKVDGDYFCYTRHEPVGICGQIIPWNFPCLMLSWKVAPALATGNVIILKPAEQTPLSAIFFASLVKEVGFPPGVVNVLPGFGPTAGMAIVEHPDIRKLAFTGSTEIGKMVAARAIDLNLKRCTLELGGKSPIIVMPDADIDQAIQSCHVGIFLNSGQVCTAGSRLFVHEDIYDIFIDLLVKRANENKVGCPFESHSIDQGPQISKEQLDKILDLIESGKKEGAKLHCGGNQIGTEGYFVEPTIFSEVKPSMRLWREEIFGPVQSVIKFKTRKEVVDLANDTQYGLAASVFTKNIDDYLTLSNQLQAGMVWVNDHHVFDTVAPFGGFKMSGMGRELSEYGLQQYTEVKVVFVKHGSEAKM